MSRWLHGATGGKALGAGGGGCLLFLSPSPTASTRCALPWRKQGVQIMPFNLDRQGLQVWQAG